LIRRAGGDILRLTARHVGLAAAEGNRTAVAVLAQSCGVLGWAIAQTITLLAPEVVVLGGGVSLLGEELFLAPLRRAVERYVFPPLLGTYRIVPAALGEAVVVHGALALAAG
jgi:glucokinase